ncbi:hypothetical protein HDV05_005713 [Chytridiales sp. JEL 0842]|nr:hypothetical protein HDV05_005713 [Chytridiales sp. JEL 0842]
MLDGTAEGVRPYVSRYVRELWKDEARVMALKASLGKGRAFTERAFAIVVMIDISKYSKIMGELAQYGKLASEIMTQGVGIINIVSTYHGDCVKFLGDALLITFQQLSSEDTESMIVQRSIACCLHILRRHSLHKIQPKNLAMLASQTNLQFNDNVSDEYKLQLHIAITAGDIRHVVLGNFGGVSRRLDYCIYGQCMNRLDEVLSSAKPGELGIDLKSDLSRIVQPLLGLGDDVMEKGSLILSEVDQGQISGTLGILDEFASGSKQEASASTKRTLGQMLLSPTSLTSPASPSLPLTLPAQDTVGSLKSKSSAQLLQESPPISDADDVIYAQICLDKIGYGRGLLEELQSDSDGDENRKGAYDFFSKFINKAVVMRLQDFANTVSAHQDTINTPDAENAEPLGGEFRNIAVVFCKLNFEFDVGRSQKTMDVFLKALQLTQGIFQQFSIDDKGQTMLAVFGLPPFTHLNEAQEATKSALAFLAELSRLDIGPVSVGISLGPIFFSGLGTKLRREAGLLGHVVNMAARLMSILPSGIVVDEDAQSKIQGVYNMESIGMKQLKGRDSAVELFLVQEAPKAPDSQRRFGYNEEKTKISSSVGSWLTGDTQKQIIFVEGKSGMGKTILSEYLTGIANDNDIEVCLIQGSEIRQYTPYFGLRPLMQHLLNYAASQKPLTQPSGRPSVTNPQSRTRSRHSFSTSLMTINANLGQVENMLRVFGEDSSLAPLFHFTFNEMEDGVTAASEGSKDLQTKRNIFKTLAQRLLVKWMKAGGKCIIIFDDAQWIDTTTLSLITDAIDEDVKSFIGFFTRPYQQNAFLDKLRAFSYASAFSLKGLSAVDVQEIILHRFKLKGTHLRSIEPRIVDAVFSRSEGSPLFVELMSEHLINSMGQVLRVKDECLVLDQTTIDISEFICQSIGSAVMLQYDRMDPMLKVILKFASVLGQYFDLVDVLSIGKISMDAEEALDLIRKADTMNYLTLHETPNHACDTDNSQQNPNSCSFRHIALMNSIYESISFSERSKINTVAGEYYEAKLMPNNRYHLLPLLKFHFSRSQDFGKYMTYAEELGMYYVNTCNFREAIDTLETLVQFIEKHYDTIQKEGKWAHFLENRRLARWYAFLVTARAESRWFFDDDSFTNQCLRGLELVKFKLPRDSAKFKMYIPLSIMKFARLWVVTRGGKVEYRFKEGEREVNETRRRIFIGMGLAATYESTFDMDLAGITIFELLSSSIVLAAEDQMQWCQALCRMAFLLIYAVPAMSQILYDKAHKIWCPATSARVEPMGTGMNFVLNLYRKRFDRCDFYGDEYMRIQEERGDRVGYFIGVSFLSGYNLFKGDLSYAEINMPTRVLPPSERDLWHAYYCIYMIVVAFVKGETSQVEEIFAEYEDYVRNQRLMHNPLGYVTTCMVAIMRGVAMGKKKELYEEIERLTKWMELQYWNKAFSPSVDTLMILPLALFSIFHENDEPSAADISILQRFLRKTVRVTKHAMSKNIIILRYPLHLFEGYLDIASGRRKEGARRVFSAYNRLSKDLEDLVPWRGIYEAFIGLYKSDMPEKERHAFLERSHATFTSMRATRLANIAMPKA